MQANYIYFSTQRNALVLDAFVGSNEAYKHLCIATNSFFASDILSLEILLAPTEPGSVIDLIKVTAKFSKRTAKTFIKGVSYAAASFAALATFLSQDQVVKACVELTGKEPYEIIIPLLKKALADRVEVTVKGSGDSILTGLHQEYARYVTDEDVCRMYEAVVTQFVQAALYQDRSTLERALGGADEQIKYEIVASQSEFYRACLLDDEISAVGFSRDNSGPSVKRNGFPDRARKPKKPFQEIDSWEFSREILLVHSVNFKRSTQSKWKWRGATLDGVGVSFTIEDENFWHEMAERSIAFDDETQMEAQFLVGIKDGKIVLREVMRVLELDGREISTELSEEEIEALLAKRQSPDDYGDQPSFDL